MGAHEPLQSVRGELISERAHLSDRAVIQIRWPAAGARDAVLDDRVHVWAAELDVDGDRRAALVGTLSGEERARAERLRVQTAADRFVAGRGLLRELLAAYLNVPARDVSICIGSDGKPLLSAAAHPRAPRFNVAHSAGLALYAIARDRTVGVDVEAIAPQRDMAGVTARRFSGAERAALARIEPEARIGAFFATWTRKEAFLKAVGTGLRTPLSSFEVSVERDAPARVIRVDGDDAGRWSLAHLEPAEGFVGAVAVEAPAGEVVCRWWRA